MAIESRAQNCSATGMDALLGGSPWPFAQADGMKGTKLGLLAGEEVLLLLLSLESNLY